VKPLVDGRFVQTYTALAGGFGVGTTSVFRYVREGVDVLADLAPTLN
jgi:hypothetical protein